MPARKIPVKSPPLARRLLLRALVPAFLLCLPALAGCSLAPEPPSSFAGRAEDGDVVWVRWTEDDDGSLTGQLSETQMDSDTLEVEETRLGFTGTRDGEEVQMSLGGYGSMEGTIVGDTLTLDFPAGDDYQQAEVEAGGQEEYVAAVRELGAEAAGYRREREAQARADEAAREEAADGLLQSIRASVATPGAELPHDYCPPVEEQIRYVGSPERTLGTSSDPLSEEVTGTLEVTSLDTVRRSSGWDHTEGTEEGEYLLRADLEGEMELDQEIDPAYGETGPRTQAVSGDVSVSLEYREEAEQYDVVNVIGAGNLDSPSPAGDGLYVDDPGFGLASLEGCETD